MKSLATLASIVGLAAAHMEIKQPAPFRSKFNEFTTDIDYSMTSPLEASGSNFPCKGYHDLFGTPQGQSVVTYTPGETYQVVVTGGTIHNGGSCQVSLSFDRGNSWTVIHSYIGNCPSATGDTSYDFVIPSDTPQGEAIFAWSWFNNLGNREMYMNCASVTIGPGGGSPGTTPFDNRPDMFVANVANGCATEETFDVEFPNPGPDVTRDDSNAKTAPPTGNCGGGRKVSVPSSPSQSSVPGPSPTGPPSGAGPRPPPPPGDEPPSPIVSQQPSPDSSTKTSTTVSAPAPAETKKSGDSFEEGQACEQEGEWYCVDGSRFQRCATGKWSELVEAPDGTTCTPGQGSELLLVSRVKSPADMERAKILRRERRKRIAN